MRYLRYLSVVILIGIALALIFSRFAASYQDMPILFKEAKKNLLWFLLFLTVGYYLVFGLLSKTILSIVGAKISLKETFKVGLLGAVGFQIAPFVGGAILVYLFYKKLKIPSSKILFLVSLIFIFNTFNIAVFFLASALLLKQSLLTFLPQAEFLIIGMVFLFAIGLAWILLKREAENLICFLYFVSKPINALARIFGKKDFLTEVKIKRVISGVLKDIGFVSQNKAKSLQALILSIVFYLTSISALYLCFRIFGFKPSIPLLVIGLTFSLLLSILSLFPEAPGVMEASMVTVFIGLGFPAHVSLFAALLYRLAIYWLAMPFGFWISLGLNKKSVIDNDLNG